MDNNAQPVCQNKLKSHGQSAPQNRLKNGLKSRLKNGQMRLKIASNMASERTLGERWGCLASPGEACPRRRERKPLRQHAHLCAARARRSRPLRACDKMK